MAWTSTKAMTSAATRSTTSARGRPLSNSALLTPEASSHGAMKSAGEYQTPPIAKLATTATALASQLIEMSCIVPPRSPTALPVPCRRGRAWRARLKPASSSCQGNERAQPPVAQVQPRPGDDAHRHGEQKGDVLDARLGRDGAAEIAGQQDRAEHGRRRDRVERGGEEGDHSERQRRLVGALATRLSHDA